MPVGALPFILLLVIVFDRNTEIKIEDIITIYVELNNNNNNNIFDIKLYLLHSLFNHVLFARGLY
jgi:hypothetical protein